MHKIGAFTLAFATNFDGNPYRNFLPITYSPLPIVFFQEFCQSD
jgi:hypothetical protein